MAFLHLHFEVQKWVDAGGSELNVCAAKQSATSFPEQALFIFVNLSTEVFALLPSGKGSGAAINRHLLPSGVTHG